MSSRDLPLSRQITYALGQYGWSTLINIINLQLVFFYLPPENAGIPQLIPTFTFLGILNLIAIAAASGRLFDAITDPLIASLSDRSKNPKGRRLPFMLKAAVPTALFSFLIFLPPDDTVTTANVIWLFVVQILFFLSLTFYVTPYFALIPEFGHTPVQKLNLSTYISVTYALGIMTAAQAPALANIFESSFGLTTFKAIQYAVLGLAGFALVLMLLPSLTIKEKEYSSGEPSSIPMKEALLTAFKNRDFRSYVYADFTYFAALSVIMTGLLYYTTVLLFPEDEKKGKDMVGLLLTVMVVVSFIFYPLVNLLARKFGKKLLVLGAFLLYGLVFGVVYLLGTETLNSFLSADAQAWLLILLASIPISALGILPNAILADIADHSALKTGRHTEGMFFAARTFMQKMGQTFGIFLFAVLTTFGRDPGDSFGIRLSGVAGLVLCVFAYLAFRNYREKTILKETEELQQRE